MNIRTKIICLILAAVVCIQAISISVFAEPAEGFVNILTQFAIYNEHLKEYNNGDITLEQLDEYKNILAKSCSITIIGDVLNVTGLMKLLDGFGVYVDNYWDDYYGRPDGDPSFDMQGYGAVFYTQTNSLLDPSCTQFDVRYCDYMVIDLSINKLYLYGFDKWYIYNSTCDVNNTHRYQYYDDIKWDTPYHGSYYKRYDEDSYSYNYYYYGDVRYIDGTPADDLTTEITTTVPNWDDTSVNEDTLEKFFDDLLDKLKLEYPDLSTIEGLLSAIYARLGTLDSDNDNAILSTINSSIQSLKTSIDNLNIDTDKSINIKFGDFTLDDIFSGNKVFSDNVLNFYFKPKDDDYAKNKFSDLKKEFEDKFSFIDTLEDKKDFYIDEFKKLWNVAEQEN